MDSARGERNEEIKNKRLELPWVPVEEEYEFDTEDGKKTLAELFDGRSQPRTGVNALLGRVQVARVGGDKAFRVSVLVHQSTCIGLLERKG